MNLVWHSLKKDVRQLRFVVMLWLTAIVAQTVLGAIAPSTTDRPVLWIIYQMVARLVPALQYLLLIVLIPLVIQQDPLVDARAFWLTRPISRRTLLAGKALFLGLVIVLPVVIGEAVVVACSGLSSRLVWLAIPEVFLEVAARTCVIAVLAAFTSSFARFAVAGVCYLVGWGIASFAVNVLLHLLPFVASPREYDFTTGMLLSQKMADAGATVLIGAGVLAWLYLVRRKKTAMVLALGGALCTLVVRDLSPWAYAKTTRSAVAAAPAPKPADVELTIDSITANENPLPQWKRLQTFKATFSLRNPPKATLLEIARGQLGLTPPDGRTYTGWISGALDGFKAETPGVPSSALYPPSAALAETFARDLGNIRILDPWTNALTSATGLCATVTMAEPAGCEACQGRELAVTGEVDVVASGYTLAARAALKSGACLSFGLDGDRILGIGEKEGTDVLTVATARGTGASDATSYDDRSTRIRVRRRIANLAFESEKNADTMQQRMLPWQDTAYLLINRKQGNEVALCEAVENNDVFFLMTMALRMMSPVRLDYCDAKLIFPPLTAEWLKDAELVCFRKTQLGTFSKAIGAADLLMGVAAQKKTAAK